MKNKKITRKITQGVYVLTTNGGGCIVDAVSQVSAGENPLISVAVMKKNFTNELIHKNQYFALSVLGVENSGKLIETFGMHSMRDMDKFQNVSVEYVLDTPIIQDSLGYMVCEIVDRIENDTHTLIIGKLVEADVYKEEVPMSYLYYQEHKEDLVKVKTESGKTAWVCKVCGYVYYGESVPDDFRCPVCGVEKKYFKQSD